MEEATSRMRWLAASRQCMPAASSHPRGTHALWLWRLGQRRFKTRVQQAVRIGQKNLRQHMRRALNREDRLIMQERRVERPYRYHMVKHVTDPSVASRTSLGSGLRSAGQAIRYLSPFGNIKTASPSELVQIATISTDVFKRHHRLWSRIAGRCMTLMPRLSGSEMAQLMHCFATVRFPCAALLRAVVPRMDQLRMFLSGSDYAMILHAFAVFDVKDPRVLRHVLGAAPQCFLDEDYAGDSSCLHRDLALLCKACGHFGEQHNALLNYTSETYRTSIDRYIKAIAERQRCAAERVGAGQLFELPDVDQEADDQDIAPPSSRDISHVVGAFSRLQVKDEPLCAAVKTLITRTTPPHKPVAPAGGAAGTYWLAADRYEYAHACSNRQTSPPVQAAAGGGDESVMGLREQGRGGGSVYRWGVGELTRTVTAMADCGYVDKDVTVRWMDGVRKTLHTLDIETTVDVLRAADRLGCYSRWLLRRVYNRLYKMMHTRTPPPLEVTLDLLDIYGQLPYAHAGLSWELHRRVARIGASWTAAALPPLPSDPTQDDTRLFLPSPCGPLLPHPQPGLPNKDPRVSSLAPPAAVHVASGLSSSVVAVEDRVYVPTTSVVGVGRGAVLPWRPVEFYFPDKVPHALLPRILQATVGVFGSMNAPIPVSQLAEHLNKAAFAGLPTSLLLDVMESCNDHNGQQQHQQHQQQQDPSTPSTNLFDALPKVWRALDRRMATYLRLPPDGGNGAQPQQGESPVFQSEGVGLREACRYARVMAGRLGRVGGGGGDDGPMDAMRRRLDGTRAWIVDRLNDQTPHQWRTVDEAIDVFEFALTPLMQHGSGHVDVAASPTTAAAAGAVDAWGGSVALESISVFLSENGPLLNKAHVQRLLMVAFTALSHPSLQDSIGRLTSQLHLTTAESSQLQSLLQWVQALASIVSAVIHRLHELMPIFPSPWLAMAAAESSHLVRLLDGLHGNLPAEHSGWLAELYFSSTMQLAQDCRRLVLRPVLTRLAESPALLLPLDATTLMCLHTALQSKGEASAAIRRLSWNALRFPQLAANKAGGPFTDLARHRVSPRASGEPPADASAAPTHEWGERRRSVNDLLSAEHEMRRGAAWSATPAAAGGGGGGGVDGVYSYSDVYSLPECFTASGWSSASCSGMEGGGGQWCVCARVLRGIRVRAVMDV
ncbi:unnamed protein product [Vitrella brassicaformis CCMP3155]|uniref:Uncharacterized protein n=1 Tax=Vitrella brassicaformis (strain CCMP3155) TaxID=1169540 RepID=A0A0G4EZU1_VITBC|nr:unnamed protein product [Vitrella brassicaformis CCMP3155]|eukprot:CEM05145.1 unnamed protein product [Vitrella brassicaformis CCMP3155]